MNWLRRVAGTVGLALPVAWVACGGSSSTTTAPSAQTYTEVFTGTLLPGGTNKDANRFTVHQAGYADATITKLSPLSTITVGLGVGVYDSVNMVCDLQVLADAAKVNQVLAVNVPSTGDLCVGIYDVGSISGSVDFEISVTHT